jgi:predicted RNase H-like HicB family nuclease
MSIYTVQVFRDSDQWVIEVPDLDVVGQARTLAGAADTARELIALWFDVDPAGVDVVMDYSRVDPDAVSLAAGARAEQAHAEELSRQAAVTWRKAARRLVHDDHLSVRDAAAVLGVSFGRVQQLMRDRAS